MAFLDGFSKTLAGKSKEAAQKAKDVAEVLQLKAQISSEKSKIKEFYASIGNLYFKKHREDAEDDYQLFFKEIEAAFAHIEEMEEKIRQLDGSKVCSSCGAPLHKDDSFCGKCGAAAPVPEEPEKAEEPAQIPENVTEDAAEAADEPETANEDAPGTAGEDAPEAAGEDEDRPEEVTIEEETKEE